MRKTYLIYLFLVICTSQVLAQTDYAPSNSYLGSLNDDYVQAIHPYGTGILVCGSTYSADSIPFPPGPSYSENQNDSMLVNGFMDVYISYFDSQFNVHHYSEFFGGSGDDFLNASVLVGDSLLYILGKTNSVDLPVTDDAAQEFFQGETDLFIALVDMHNPDSLIYCTYLGGSGNDYGIDLTVDSTGVVHVLFNSNSADILEYGTTALDDSLGGEGDAYWLSLSASLDSILSIKPIGSPGLDVAADLLLLGDSVMYILLNSDNGSFLSYDSTATFSSDFNVHLTSWDPHTRTLLSEYVFQGNAMDIGASMLFFQEQILLCGTTLSLNFPTTENADFQSMDPEDPMQAFILSFDLQGDSISYCSYIGGTEHDLASELHFIGGYPTLLGQTDSYDFPTVGDPFNPFSQGQGDLFMCRLDSSLSINGGTYFGYSSNDFLNQEDFISTFETPELGTLSELLYQGIHLCSQNEKTQLAFHLQLQLILGGNLGMDFLPNGGLDCFLLAFDQEDGPCGEPCSGCVCNGSGSGTGSGNGNGSNYDPFTHLCLGEDYDLTVSTSMIFPLFQWHSFGQDQGPTALEDGLQFQGTQSDTLHILNAQLELDDLIFKCQANNTFKIQWFSPIRIKVHEIPFNPISLMDTLYACPGDSLLILLNDSMTMAWGSGDFLDSLWISPIGLESYEIIAQSLYCNSETALLIADNYPAPGPISMQAFPESICVGDSVLLTASGSLTYIWPTGDSGSMSTVLPDHTYYHLVTGFDENNCMRQDSISVIVHELPQLSADIMNETCVQNDDGSIDLDVFSVVPLSLLWSNGSTMLFIDSLSEGSYSVQVEDLNGCVNEGEYVVINDSSNCEYIIFLPLIFSPNGDGQNDVFMLQGEEIEQYSLTVYDLQGRVIFSSFLADQGWDGTHSGNPSPQGVYMYRLKGRFTDGREFDEWNDITLIR